MNLKFRIFIMQLIVMFNCINIINGQEKDNIPYFIPPSPSAYSINCNNQISNKLFTGTPNVEIPLLNYKTVNLKVPISLNYGSNGILVDQLETNVGLGWNLAVGGVISRIVRDLPDEQTNILYPKNSINNLRNPLTIDFFYKAGLGENDTEVDLFNYNFQGYSGEFVFDKYKSIVKLKQDALKIEPIFNDSNTGFLITTPDGIKYFFYDIETTVTRQEGGGHSEPSEDVITAWYLSKIVHPCGDVINFTYKSFGYSYYSSISQTEKVAYPAFQSLCDNSIPTTPEISTIKTKNTITGKLLSEISSNNIYDGRIVFKANYYHPNISNYKLINNISFLNKDSLIINSYEFNYNNSPNNRVFLNSIVNLDPRNVYKFKYISPDLLPVRLSYSQDSWGYFNGMNNVYFVPTITDHSAFIGNGIGGNRDLNTKVNQAGLLNSVIYPTGGMDSIVYEPNTNYGSKTIPGHLTETYVSTSTDSETSGIEATKTCSIYCPYKQVISFYLGLSFNSNDCSLSEDVGKTKVNITIKNNNTGVTYDILKYSSGAYTVNSSLFSESEAGGKFYADLDSGSYTFTLKPNFICINSSLTISYYDTKETTINTNLETGGVRVKYIYRFDPISKKFNITKYYYGPKDDLNKSSGVIGKKSYYISEQTVKQLCPSDEVVQPVIDIQSAHYYILTSSSLIPLFISGTPANYKYVTISYGGDNFENGGEEHTFIINKDTDPKQIWGDNILYSCPLNNSGWNNGLETNISFFKILSDKKILIRNIFNDYFQDTRNYHEIVGYSVRKNYENILKSPTYYVCTNEDAKNDWYFQLICTTNHKHLYYSNIFNNDYSYLLLGLLYINEPRCIAPGNNNEKVFQRGVCYENEGDTILYSNQIDNLDIMSYINIGSWSYLRESIETTYDINGLNPISISKNFIYDDSTYMQLSKNVTKTSNNELLTDKYYYANNLDIPLLVNNYCINEPVQVEKYKNDKLLFTQKSFYKDWGNNIIKSEFLKEANDNISLDSKIQYFGYDTLKFGVPLELSKTNDSHSVYFWSYNGKYPIIMVENSDYTTLSNAVTSVLNNLMASSSNKDIQTFLDNSIVNMSTSDQKANWKAFDKGIRNEFSGSKVFITTYTYDPLIGMTSQTDPNGVTTYYEYDTFGRLKLIRDDDGNILKTYEYNYKQ